MSTPLLNYSSVGCIVNGVKHWSVPNGHLFSFPHSSEELQAMEE